MPSSIRPGDVLAGRYRLVDLLSESGDGRFWRAHDRVLERHVAIHVISAEDARAESLLEAARRSATVLEPRILRVLDAERSGGLCYVVNEWGQGTSLDIMLASGGVLTPRKAAWIAGEVAGACRYAHHRGVPHGRLNPENVLVDTSGSVRVIGWAVDAALHGRPAGTTEDDLADLAAVLYAGLTGRWPGRSDSAVPHAPRDHGQVLRPRQVRAGIPRTLDEICDAVLNPGREQTPDAPTTVAGVVAALDDFVGDPTGIPEALVQRLVARGEPVSLPAVPEIAVRTPDDTPGDASADPLADTAGGSDAQPTAPVDVPTEAALPPVPLDGPGAAPETPPAPPPPLEEPPQRPLFAPEPTDGSPARRPRVDARTAGDPADYWPWDTGSVPPSASTTGDLHAVPPAEVPGRNALRVGAVLLACLLLFVAIAVAFNLGRGRTPLGAVPEDDQSPSTSASATPQAEEPTPLTPVAAADLDPETDGEENPDAVPNVLDGDPGTTWRTSTYLQQLGPAGLKTGVGLVLDLGEAADVAGVDLQLVGEPTTAQVFVTDEQPTTVEGLTPAGELTAGTEGVLDLEEPVTGQYVVVWLTSLPTVPDGFRGEVAEVQVRGVAP